MHDARRFSSLSSHLFFQFFFPFFFLIVRTKWEICNIRTRRGWSFSEFKGRKMKLLYRSVPFSHSGKEAAFRHCDESALAPGRFLEGLRRVRKEPPTKNTSFTKVLLKWTCTRCSVCTVVYVYPYIFTRQDTKRIEFRLTIHCPQTTKQLRGPREGRGGGGCSGRLQSAPALNRILYMENEEECQRERKRKRQEERKRNKGRPLILH